MKKFIVFLTVFSLSLVAVAPVLAEEPDASPIVPGPNGETASPAPEPIVNGTAVLPSVAAPSVYKRSLVAVGELMTISGKELPVDLTVKLTRITPRADKKITGYPAVGASVTVHVTDKSKIVRQYMGRAHLSELAVGDKLDVVGKMDVAGVITAQLVKDDSIDMVTIVPGKDELKALKEAAKNKAMIKELEKKQSNLEKQLLKIKGKALEKKQGELDAIKKKLLGAKNNTLPEKLVKSVELEKEFSLKLGESAKLGYDTPGSRVDFLVELQSVSKVGEALSATVSISGKEVLNDGSAQGQSWPVKSFTLSNSNKEVQHGLIFSLVSLTDKEVILKGVAALY